MVFRNVAVNPPMYVYTSVPTNLDKVANSQKLKMPAGIFGAQIIKTFSDGILNEEIGIIKK